MFDVFFDLLRLTVSLHRTMFGVKQTLVEGTGLRAEVEGWYGRVRNV